MLKITQKFTNDVESNSPEVVASERFKLGRKVELPPFKLARLGVDFQSSMCALGVPN
jgi:hypothetical protein